MPLVSWRTTGVVAGIGPGEAPVLPPAASAWAEGELRELAAFERLHCSGDVMALGADSLGGVIDAKCDFRFSCWFGPGGEAGLGGDEGSRCCRG